MLQVCPMHPQVGGGGVGLLQPQGGGGPLGLTGGVTTGGVMIGGVMIGRGVTTLLGVLPP